MADGSAQPPVENKDDCGEEGKFRLVPVGESNAFKFTAFCFSLNRHLGPSSCLIEPP